MASRRTFRQHRDDIRVVSTWDALTRAERVVDNVARSWRHTRVVIVDDAAGRAEFDSVSEARRQVAQWRHAIESVALLYVRHPFLDGGVDVIVKGVATEEPIARVMVESESEVEAIGLIEVLAAEVAAPPVKEAESNSAVDRRVPVPPGVKAEPDSAVDAHVPAQPAARTSRVPGWAKDVSVQVVAGVLVAAALAVGAYLFGR